MLEQHDLPIPMSAHEHLERSTRMLEPLYHPREGFADLFPRSLPVVEASVQITLTKRGLSVLSLVGIFQYGEAFPQPVTGVESWWINNSKPGS